MRDAALICLVLTACPACWPCMPRGADGAFKKISALFFRGL